MKICLMSDLHLEFHKMEVPFVEDAEDTVLVLAGDIGVANKPHTYVPFIKQASKQFQQVLWVPGNHEYYHSSLIDTKRKVDAQLAEHGLANVMFGNDIWISHDTLVVFTTLWTNFNNQNPNTMMAVQGALNDYGMIYTGTLDDPYKRLIVAEDTLREFDEAYKFIEHVIDNFSDQYKIVVVTHHGPSYKSVAPKYRGSGLINYGFVSELEEFIMAHQPNYWLHGHTHSSIDYNIGETRVLTNPRGYPNAVQGIENANFNSSFVIDV